uniref:Secreted protein n=1 Tax=Arion vulgaris TaxID=1028688 RepID=A0A0B7BAL3_9EUPU
MRSDIFASIIAGQLVLLIDLCQILQDSNQRCLVTARLLLKENHENYVIPRCTLSKKCNSVSHAPSSEKTC